MAGVTKLNRDAEAVLALWREIERAIEKTDSGSPEFERLVTDAAMLRDEYQRLVAEARAAVSSSLLEPGDPA